MHISYIIPATTKTQLSQSRSLTVIQLQYLFPNLEVLDSCLTILQLCTDHQEKLKEAL